MSRAIQLGLFGLVLLIGAAIVRGGAPVGADLLRQDEATPAAPTIVREVLGTTQPAEAPGYDLDFARYTIPAGAVVAPHSHPGTQVVSIFSGELTYHVITGEATVTHGATTATPTVEVVQAGQSTILRAGDNVVETPGMIHSAENLGPEPVVNYAAALFVSGGPLSIPATPAA
jgi:quercetin dioxygenase-like cupin family protein